MNQVVNDVAKKLKSEFYFFFRVFWHKISADEFVKSKHIKFLCNELQELGQHIIDRTYCGYDYLVINVPPGSSKSSIVSVMFPTWLLTNDPSVFVINTSYSSDLATGFIRRSKNITDSEAYNQFFGHLQLTKDNEGHIETRQSGGRYATSTGGTITGAHGNLIISDDPLSVEQSYSKQFRDRANRYLLQTLATRKRDKQTTPTILIMQRLHEEDPSGTILSSNIKYKHICLPAELSNLTTHPELYTDGLLDPDRMNRDVLEGMRATLGAYGYAGQFEQKPAPDDGKIKKTWFEIVDTVPAGNKTVYIDGAYTKNTANDPTGIMTCIMHQNDIYVTDWQTKYLEMPELMDFVSLHCSDAMMIKIEPKASGSSLRQLLQRHTRLNVMDIQGKHVSEGKEARVSAASPSMQSGRVKLVRGQWNESFLHELTTFPAGKHDEAVDCLCYAIFDFYINKKRKLVSF